MYKINKTNLTTILKKSDHSITIDKNPIKTGDKFKINIEGQFKGEKMNNKMPEWFKAWNDSILMPRLDKMDQRLDKMDQRLDKVDQRLDNIEKDVAEIKIDITAMKNTPTMQRELNLR